MTPEAYVRARIAEHAWTTAPADDRSYNVLKCIACITRNRVKAGWHGGDWLAVMDHEALYSYQSLEFQGAARLSANLPELHRREAAMGLSPDLGDRTFQKFLLDVDRIYDGQLEPDPSNGGLWWAQPNNITREWFLENITRKRNEKNEPAHPPIANVGTIMVYA